MQCMELSWRAPTHTHAHAHTHAVRHARTHAKARHEFLPDTSRQLLNWIYLQLVVGGGLVCHRHLRRLRP
eukprot:1003775-Amphidinium_carterae.2